MSDPTLVKLTNVILSYPNFYHAKKIAGGDDLKYSAAFILPQGYDTALIMAAVSAAAAASQLNANQAKNTTLGKAKDDHQLAGSNLIKTTNYSDNESSRAQVLYPDLVTPITDENVLFAGCIVDALVHFKGYPTGLGGVRCEAKVVILRNNGVEPLVEGSRVDAMEHFTPVAGAPAQQQGLTQQQPAQQGFTQQQPAQQGFTQQQGVPAGAPNTSDDPWNQ